MKKNKPSDCREAKLDSNDDLRAKHALSKKDLCRAYGVSFVTLRKWLRMVSFTESPVFGRKGYSREQIKVIFDKLETPFDN